MRFRTVILQNSKTATGIHVPDKIVSGLSESKRPAVRVTINGYTYRSTIAHMGNRFMVGVSADVRAKAKVAGGDEINVEIEIDSLPREAVVPVDFKRALNKSAQARAKFESLSYSGKQRHILSIEGAKTDETRQRRIDKAVKELRARR